MMRRFLSLFLITSLFLNQAIMPASSALVSVPHAFSANKSLWITQALSPSTAFSVTPISSAVRVTAVKLARSSVELQIHWAAVSHDPANQWKPHSQAFTLKRGDLTVSGELFWMLDHVYIRAGERWVRFPASSYSVSDAEQADAAHSLPWGSLLSGPLLVGNPSLQTFMQTGITTHHFGESLPEGAELVVEKPGFTTTHYDRSHISRAEDVLANASTFASYRDQHLSEQELAQFLDAYILISGAGAGHEHAYDKARQQLNFLIGGIQDAGAETLYGISIDQFKLLRVLGEKRRLGFNFITADLVKKLSSVVAESITPNGEVFILGRDGHVTRADAINSGNLVPTSNAPHIHDLQEAARDGNFSRFVVPFLMYGGNATRIRDTVFANKVTGAFFWVSGQGAVFLDRLLRKSGLHAMANAIQASCNLYQVSMMHVLAVMMPRGIYLAGSSSLVAGAEMVGAENQLVQNIAHQIDENGAIKPLTTDLAGHGDSFKGLISSMPAIQDAIKRAGVIVLSNAEFYDPAMFESIAMQVATGKNVTAIAVFPQSVKIVAPGFDTLVEAFESGRVSQMDIGQGLKNITNIDKNGKSVTFEDHTQYSFAGVLSSAQRQWDDLHYRLEQANAVANPTGQRDLIIDIMHDFEETLQTPLSRMVITITTADGSTKKVPAFRIDTNDGGMLSEVQGVISFVEKSQFGSEQTLRKSNGQTVRVTRKTIESIWFKNFNPQFFGWDSFAVKACLTQQAQTLYREYREALARANSDQERLSLRETYAQKIYSASPELTADTWSQLAEMLDLLQSVLMVPPFEAKGTPGVDRYFKINKMAQQVMVFMVALATSGVNMEDIDLHALQEAVKRLQSASSEEERMSIRNSIRFRHGKTIHDLAQDSIPQGPLPAGLVRVETRQFVQVKKPEDTAPFVEAVNQLFSREVPEGLLIPSTMESLTWVATGNMARELLALGVLSDELAKTIGWAAWHEGLHVGAIKEATERANPLVNPESWEAQLLIEFRNLVVKGLAKDVWTGWQAFANKWKDAKAPVSPPGDSSGIDFRGGAIYSPGSLSAALPRRAA